MGLYFLPPCVSTCNRPAYNLPSSPLVAVSKANVGYLFNYDFKRLQQLAQLPPILNPFCSFPEVLVGIPFCGFLLFGASYWQVPLLVTTAFFINGQLIKSARNYEHAVVWNYGFPPLATPSSAATPAGGAASTPSTRSIDSVATPATDAGGLSLSSPAGMDADISADEVSIFCYKWLLLLVSTTEVSSFQIYES